MKMIFSKYVYIVCYFIFGLVTLKAQIVQINTTSNILFRIDPLGNSNGSLNSSDDVSVTNTGAVGLGIINPRAKLDINGTLRIVDGGEMQNALYVSDATGLGSWTDVDLIGRIVVEGVVATGTSLSSAYVNITNTPLELKGGTWMIVGRADVIGTSTGTELRPPFVWLKIEEQTTNSNGTTTSKTVSEAGLPYMIRTGVYSSYYATPMVMAFVSIPIQTTNPIKKKYTLYAKSPSTLYKSPRLTNNLSGAYFYAIRLLDKSPEEIVNGL